MKYDIDTMKEQWDGLTMEQQIDALQQAKDDVVTPPVSLGKELWNVCTHYFKEKGLARVAHIEGGGCEAIELTDLGIVVLDSLKQRLSKGEDTPQEQQKQPQDATNTSNLAVIPKEPQQAAQGLQIGNNEPQQEKTLQDLLPEQLRGADAVAIFQRAIDANMIEKTAIGVLWQDTKQLLAYFAERMSSKFKLSSKLDRDGRTTIDWKTFESLFGVKDLKGAKQNWMRLNTRFEPTGFERVDALF